MENKNEENDQLDKFYQGDVLILNTDEFMYCTFKTINHLGIQTQCASPVKKSNINKDNFNNNYCAKHQEFVDEINQKRILEANQKLKENINLYITQEYEKIKLLNHQGLGQQFKGQHDALSKLQKKLNKDDFLNK